MRVLLTPRLHWPKYRPRWVASWLVSCWVLGSLVSPRVQAQTTPFDVSISPPVSYLSLEPEQKLIWTITLHNYGFSPVTLQPSWHTFTVPASGLGLHLEDSSDFPYASASSALSTITIEPGATKPVPLYFDIPANAPTQEFHQTLLFTANPVTPVSPDLSQADLSGAIATNVILSVKGTVPAVATMEVSSVAVPHWLDSFRPLRFSAIVQNTGNRVGQASGSAELRSWNGQKVQTWPVFPDRVLAGQPRALRTSELSPSDDASAAALMATETFEYHPPIWFGPYRLQIWLSPDGQSPAQLMSETTLIVFPFSAVFVGMLILGSYSVFVRISRRPIHAASKKLK